MPRVSGRCGPVRDPGSAPPSNPARRPDAARQDASRFSVSASFFRFVSRVFMIPSPARGLIAGAGVFDRGVRPAAFAAARASAASRHPGRDRRLVPLVGRQVVLPRHDRVGQVLLLDVGALVVVRVAVADADPVLLHPAVRRIPKVQRDRQRAAALDVRHGRPVGRARSVRLGRRRDVGRRLGERVLRLRAGRSSRAPDRRRPPPGARADRRCRRPRTR